MEIDLSTKLGNINLRSPIIVGSCPMTAFELQRIAMVSNGAGAIVLPSLLEEQTASAMPSDQNCTTNVDSYLRLVEIAKKQTSIPVFASLSGSCSKAWGSIAKQIESAGADAIELSVRQPNPEQFFDSVAIENAILECAESIDASVAIPLLGKLTRSYTSVGHLAQQIQRCVQGLTLFGRARAVDIELDSLKMTSKWEMTEPGSIVQSLETIMRVRSLCPNLSIAASGGIWNSADLIKALLSGANAVMVTSAIYRDGATVIGSLIEGLIHYMELHDMNSLPELANQAPAIEDVVYSDSEESEAITVSASHTGSQHDHLIECDRWGHPRSI